MLIGQDDEIADWYNRHGGSTSFLGKPTDAEHPVAKWICPRPTRAVGCTGRRQPESMRCTARAQPLPRARRAARQGGLPDDQRHEAEAGSPQPILRWLVDLLVAVNRRMGGLRQGGDAMGGTRGADRPAGLPGQQHPCDCGWRTRQLSATATSPGPTRAATSCATARTYRPDSPVSCLVDHAATERP